jgi:ElaB/YqjD/DUF883 family membrane-anchored ribosome-binding protein
MTRIELFDLKSIKNIIEKELLTNNIIENTIITKYPNIHENGLKLNEFNDNISSDIKKLNDTIEKHYKFFNNLYIEIKGENTILTNKTLDNGNKFNNLFGKYNDLLNKYNELMQNYNILKDIKPEDGLKKDDISALINNSISTIFSSLVEPYIDSQLDKRVLDTTSNFFYTEINPRIESQIDNLYENKIKKYINEEIKQKIENELENSNYKFEEIKQKIENELTNSKNNIDEQVEYMYSVIINQNLDGLFKHLENKIVTDIKESVNNFSEEKVNILKQANSKYIDTLLQNYKIDAYIINSLESSIKDTLNKFISDKTNEIDNLKNALNKEISTNLKEHNQDMKGVYVDYFELKENIRLSNKNANEKFKTINEELTKLLESTKSKLNNNFNYAMAEIRDLIKDTESKLNSKFFNKEG